MECKVTEASYDKCEEAPMSKSEMTDDEVIEEKVKFYKEKLIKCLETKRRAELITIAQQKFIDENKDLIDECDKQGVSLPFALSFIHPDTEMGDEEIADPSCSSKWADKYTWLSDEEIESMKQQVFKYHEREKEIINEHFCHANDGKHPAGQLNALIDEYRSIERLKLVLVDRICSNLVKKDIHLSHEHFSSNN